MMPSKTWTYGYMKGSWIIGVCYDYLPKYYIRVSFNVPLFNVEYYKDLSNKTY